MRDPYDVLKQKEADLARVRREVESLRIVARLLLDALDSDQSEKTNLISAEIADNHLSNDPLNKLLTAAYVLQDRPKYPVVRKTHADLEPTGSADQLFSSILKHRL